MTTADTKLAEFVAKFRQWLDENYSKEEIEDLRVDEPSYPEWDEIENYFAELLKKNQISNLSPEAQKNLLYLIARNWDINHMIGWLYIDSPLSNLGDLKYSDFILLATTLSTLNHPDFNNAKSQFASSFRKFTELTPEIERLLLLFYYDKDEYTKRTALDALGKLGYTNIRSLIELSWNTVDNEHHKMQCLNVIDLYIKDIALMKEYLLRAENYEGKFLAKYVAELKTNPNYR